MNRFLISILLLMCSSAIYLKLTLPVHSIRERYTQEMLTRIGDVPSPLLKASAFEFHGLVADILLLKSFTWVGMKIGKDSALSSDEWLALYKILDRITDLDARFWDPYLFAEMMLTWQAGMMEKANILLQKAAHATPDDYRPLYFLGFNEFYFRKDAASAAPYLREAALKPGAPAFLKGLAARFSLYGNETLAGIIFLKSLIRQTTDEKTKRYLGKRLEALELIHELENSVNDYKSKFGYLPSKLEDVVKAGILNNIPVDPYGGEFRLLKNGRVYTTSKLVDKASKNQRSKR